MSSGRGSCTPSPLVEAADRRRDVLPFLFHPPQDAMAYLRLAVSLRDDVALARIINTPKRGLGDTSVEKLQAAATAQGLTLSALLFGSATAGGGLPLLPDRKELGLTPKAAAALEAFRELLLGLHGAVASQPLGRALREVVDKVRCCLASIEARCRVPCPELLPVLLPGGCFSTVHTPQRQHGQACLP